MQEVSLTARLIFCRVLAFELDLKQHFLISCRVSRLENPNHRSARLDAAKQHKHVGFERVN